MQDNNKKDPKTGMTIVVILFGLLMAYSFCGHAYLFVNAWIESDWYTASKEQPFGQFALGICLITGYLAVAINAAGKGKTDQAKAMIIWGVIVLVCVIALNSCDTSMKECELTLGGYKCY